MTRATGLSAQTIPGVPPARLVELARIGGFDRVGLDVDPATWSAGDTIAVRRALSNEGIVLQDIEVIRLEDLVTDAMRRQIDIAAALGAPWIITVSFNEQEEATVGMLGDLKAHADGSGVSPILEFGPFTAVASLTAARSIAELAGVPILADPLHLARSGEAVGALADLPPALLPYAQFCDAGTPPPDAGRDGLLAEARERRLDPGCGVLDLRGFVDALPPAIPLMNEVRSAAMAANFSDPEAHVRHLGSTTRRWLAEEEGRCGQR